MTDAEAVGVGGHDLDVERRDAELVGDELCVLRLVPVGLGRQAEHHLAGRVHAQEDRPVRLVRHRCISSRLVVVASSLVGVLAARRPFRETLTLLVRGQRVVLLEVAERGCGPPSTCGGTAGRSQPG